MYREKFFLVCVMLISSVVIYEPILHMNKSLQSCTRFNYNQFLVGKEYEHE